MTQTELADLLGVTAQSVSKWERGESLPDMVHLSEISHLLHVPADILLHENAPAEQTYIAIDSGLRTEFVLINAQGRVLNAVTLGESKPKKFGVDAAFALMRQGIDLLRPHEMNVQGIFLRGGSFEITDSDPALRAELCALAEREGNEALHALLRELDPETADAVHPNNVKRVARAIEICKTTGRKKSDLDRQSREPECPYDATVIGLHYHGRELLYDRINRRVDLMVEQGLVEETRRLREAGVFDTCQTAAQAIGYKELFPYLDGTATLESCVDVLKMATRRYAKRQLTWFRAKSYVQWVACDTLDPAFGTSEEHTIVKKFEDIVNNAKTLF
jgi:transcriptional regulator with XRE-family HTH domain